MVSEVSRALEPKSYCLGRFGILASKVVEVDTVGIVHHEEAGCTPELPAIVISFRQQEVVNEDCSANL